MGNIVWDAEKGWHDGPPAKVGLDEKGRLVIEPMTPEERATELGTEHGRKAGEAWLDQLTDCGWSLRYQLGNGWRLDALAAGWPLPTPDPECSCEVCGPEADAYSAAFTAAVEAVVREAVEK